MNSCTIVNITLNGICGSEMEVSRVIRGEGHTNDHGHCVWIANNGCLGGLELVLSTGTNVDLYCLRGGNMLPTIGENAAFQTGREPALAPTWKLSFPGRLRSNRVLSSLSMIFAVQRPSSGDMQSCGKTDGHLSRKSI